MPVSISPTKGRPQVSQLTNEAVNLTAQGSGDGLMLGALQVYGVGLLGALLLQDGNTGAEGVPVPRAGQHRCPHREGVDSPCGVPMLTTLELVPTA